MAYVDPEVETDVFYDASESFEVLDIVEDIFVDALMFL